MNYRSLGNTGLKVSEIGFGGEYLNGLSQAETIAIFDKAFELGINCLDLFMPQPDVRSNIGAAIANRRDRIIIQGHLCSFFENEQYERTRDLAKVKTAFEDLLTRLGTDYIDVGMLHYIDTEEDFKNVFNGEIIEYAKELKKQGVIRHIGISSHNPTVALKAVETGLVEVIMFSINAAYDFESATANIEELMEYKALDEDGFAVDPVRQALYAECANRGVGITVMKALGAGGLLSAESSPFKQAMSVVQCCHYCLTRNAVASVLVGFHTIDELLQAAAYSTSTDEQKNYSHIFSGNAIIKITGRCMYCNHCLPCPSQIDIASVTKFLDLALIQETIPETVKEHYNALQSKASDCVACGQCEPNCPFGVSIRENMEKAVSVFGC